MQVLGMSSQDAGFVSHRDIDNIDEADAVIFFAGIVTTFEDAEIDQRRCFDIEALEDGSPQFLGCVLAAFFGER
jgi:hypothetical protein